MMTVMVVVLKAAIFGICFGGSHNGIVEELEVKSTFFFFYWPDQLDG